MRICITSVGTGLDDQFGQQLGNSQYLLTVDLGSLEVEVAANPALGLAGGAEAQAAACVLASQANVLITGQISSEAEQLLAGGTPAVYQGRPGTVRSVLEAFQAGQLTRLLPLVEKTR